MCISNYINYLIVKQKISIAVTVLQMNYGRHSDVTYLTKTSGVNAAVRNLFQEPGLRALHKAEEYGESQCCGWDVKLNASEICLAIGGAHFQALLGRS